MSSKTEKTKYIKLRNERISQTVLVSSLNAPHPTKSINNNDNKSSKYAPLSSLPSPQSLLPQSISSATSSLPITQNQTQEKQQHILDLSDGNNNDKNAQIEAGEYVTYKQTEETVIIQAITQNENGTWDCCRVNSFIQKDCIWGIDFNTIDLVCSYLLIYICRSTVFGVGLL